MTDKYFQLYILELAALSLDFLAFCLPFKSVIKSGSYTCISEKSF